MDQSVAAETANYNTLHINNEQGILENLQLVSQLWKHIREMRKRGRTVHFLASFTKYLLAFTIVLQHQ